MNQLPATAVVADPFFEVVTRRHPDIDLVVLAAPATSEAEPVLDEQLAHVMMEVAGLARGLWARAAGPEMEPLARFSYGDGPDTVRAEARCRAEREDGRDVIGRMRDELVHGGWEVHHSAEGTPRLRARKQAVDVVASYVAQTGAVLFRVSGPCWQVGRARARELTSNGGR
ncbi:hypothetical protein GCM10027020_17130 [Nocardioides salsibiostraticola]